MLAAIVFAAGVLAGATGFGFGMLAVGVFSLLMDVPRAAAISSLVGLSSILANVWTTRQSIDWRETWPLLISGVPATAVGVYLLTSLPVASLKTGIAIMILVGSALTFWAPPRPFIHHSWPWAYIAGAISGLFGGSVNMGGPPLVFYTLLRAWDKTLCKSAFSVVFFAVSLVRLPLYVVAGNLTLEVFMLGLALILPALAGTLLGTRVFRRMNTATFRYATTAVLVVLALRVLF